MRSTRKTQPVVTLGYNSALCGADACFWKVNGDKSAADRFLDSMAALVHMRADTYPVTATGEMHVNLDYAAVLDALHVWLMTHPSNGIRVEATRFDAIKEPGLTALEPVDAFTTAQKAYLDDVGKHTTYVPVHLSASISAYVIVCVFDGSFTAQVLKYSKRKVAKLRSNCNCLIFTMQQACDSIEPVNLNARKVGALFESFANSLGLLHLRVGYHGDLKWQNIVDCGGVCKIIDFPAYTVARNAKRIRFTKNGSMRIADNNNKSLSMNYTYAFTTRKNMDLELDSQMYDKLCYNVMLANAVSLLKNEDQVRLYRTYHFADATTFVQKNEVIALRRTTDSATVGLSWLHNVFLKRHPFAAHAVEVGDVMPGLPRKRGFFDAALYSDFYAAVYTLTYRFSSVSQILQQCEHYIGVLQNSLLVLNGGGLAVKFAQIISPYEDRRRLYKAARAVLKQHMAHLHTKVSRAGAGIRNLTEEVVLLQQHTLTRLGMLKDICNTIKPKLEYIARSANVSDVNRKLVVSEGMTFERFRETSQQASSFVDQKTTLDIVLGATIVRVKNACNLRVILNKLRQFVSENLYQLVPRARGTAETLLRITDSLCAQKKDRTVTIPNRNNSFSLK